MSEHSAGTARSHPSPEALSESSTVALLLRLLVFVLLVGAVYWVFRQLTVLLFAPEIEVIGPVVPSRELSPASTVQLGVLVTNPKPMAGAAFVVATGDDGSQIEGPTVGVPPDDTTFVPVEVRLDREDQIVSLVVFDGWRGVRRLQTFPGLRLGVTESDVAVEYVQVPDTVRGGDTWELELLVRNHGTQAVIVRPKVAFQSGPDQEIRSVGGSLVEIAAGDSTRFSLVVEGGLLEPGMHFAQAVVETREGDRRGGTRYPVPLVISN